jgi:hypothetical protein
LPGKLLLREALDSGSTLGRFPGPSELATFDLMTLTDVALEVVHSTVMVGGPRHVVPCHAARRGQRSDVWCSNVLRRALSSCDSPILLSPVQHQHFRGSYRNIISQITPSPSRCICLFAAARGGVGFATLGC